MIGKNKASLISKGQAKYPKYDFSSLEEVGPWGYYLNELDNVVILVLRSLKNYEAVVHECVHAYLSICRINGTICDPYNQEPTAYGIGDIVRKVMKGETE